MTVSKRTRAAADYNLVMEKGDKTASVLRVVDLLSEGEIGGLVNGGASVFVNGTPVLDPSTGEANFEGVEWSERVGVARQSYMPGFEEVERTLSVGRDLPSDAPWVRSLPEDSDAVRINVRWSGGLYETADDGSFKSRTVELKFELKFESESEWEEYARGSTTAGASAPLLRSFRVDLGAYRDKRADAPSPGALQLRVSRITADATGSRISDACRVESMVSIVERKLGYDDSAVVGIEIDGSNFGGGSALDRAYEIRGLLVRIPSNYDPESREYRGPWDGRFKPGRHWTDNPAWLLYDLLTSRRYGLGASIDEAELNRYSFYDAARYNDELVPSGLGNGREPRFVFNGVLSTQQEAIRTLSEVAGSFRAALYWSEGALNLFQDRPPAGVRQLVANSNVEDGDFQYGGVPREREHSVVEVSWLDPSDGWRPTVELVVDDASVQRVGWRVLRRQALGASSRGQARRVGIAALRAERRESTTVRYTAGWDHVATRPGDVILISDENRHGTQTGRVADVSGPDAEGYLHVALDRDVELPRDTGAGEGDFVFWAVSVDASVQRYILRLADSDVPPGAGGRTLRLIPLAAQPRPIVGGVWTLQTPSSAPPQEFRVMSVSENLRGFLDVEAIVHDAGKYAAIDNLEGRFESLPPPAPPPRRTVIDGFSVVESLRRVEDKVISEARLSWTPTPDASVAGYRVFLRRPEETKLSELGTVERDAAAFTLEDTSRGRYRIELAWLDRDGVPSTLRHEEDFELVGLEGPPAAPSNFMGQRSGDVVILSWTPPPDLDFSHCRLRRSFAPNPTWEEASPVEGASDLRSSTAAVPYAPETLLLKAVDSGGRESDTAAVLLPSAVLGFGAGSAYLAGQNRPETAGSVVELFKTIFPESEGQATGDRTRAFPSGPLRDARYLSVVQAMDSRGSFTAKTVLFSSVGLAYHEEQHDSRYLPLTPLRYDVANSEARTPLDVADLLGSPGRGLAYSLGFRWTNKGRESSAAPALQDAFPGMFDDLGLPLDDGAPVDPSVPRGPWFSEGRPYVNPINGSTDFAAGSDFDGGDFDQLNFGLERTNGEVVCGELHSRSMNRVDVWENLDFDESVCFNADDWNPDFRVRYRGHPVLFADGPFLQAVIDGVIVKGRDADMSNPAVRARAGDNPDFGVGLVSRRDLSPGEVMPIEDSHLLGNARGFMPTLYWRGRLMKWSDSLSNVNATLRARIEYEVEFVDELNDYRARVPSVYFVGSPSPYVPDGGREYDNARYLVNGEFSPYLPEGYKPPVESVSSLLYSDAGIVKHRIVPFEGAVSGLGVVPGFHWTVGGRVHLGTRLVERPRAFYQFYVRDLYEGGVTNSAGALLGGFSWYSVRVKSIETMVLGALRVDSAQGIRYNPAATDELSDGGWKMVRFRFPFAAAPSLAAQSEGSFLPVDVRAASASGFEFRVRNVAGTANVEGSISYQASGFGIAQEATL